MSSWEREPTPAWLSLSQTDDERVPRVPVEGRSHHANALHTYCYPYGGMYDALSWAT